MGCSLLASSLTMKEDSSVMIFISSSKSEWELAKKSTFIITDMPGAIKVLPQGKFSFVTENYSLRKCVYLIDYSLDLYR